MASHAPERSQPTPEWLSLQQAALIYGISVDTLRRRIATGALPASRIGARLIRVRIADLESVRRPVRVEEPRARRRRAW